MTHSALAIIDLQNDFLPGGALPVPHGDEVVPLANRLAPHFELVVATQDWHPANHVSFATSHPGKRPADVIDVDRRKQVLWPVHCVQNTPGAALAVGLQADRITRVFQKGDDPRIDSYSGFFDDARVRSTGLVEFLEGRGVRKLFLIGLATDHCVRATALDALSLGLRVFVIADACRGVDLRPGDSAAALDEMAAQGAEIVRSDDVPRLLVSAERH